MRATQSVQPSHRSIHHFRRSTQMSNPTAAARSATTLQGTPVSYTHLDVYKRQVKHPVDASHAGGHTAICGAARTRHFPDDRRWSCRDWAPQLPGRWQSCPCRLRSDRAPTPRHRHPTWCWDEDRQSTRPVSYTHLDVYKRQVPMTCLPYISASATLVFMPELSLIHI